MARRILFGSYELLQRIGEGGMAEVWRARARGVAGFEKTVVIKRVLPSLMARRDFAELLVREARIAALLNHPNVVQIFELGEEQGAYFIAMEYVHGCDLATAVAHQPDLLAAAREGGLDLPLRLWIALEAAQALDYAHRRRDEEGRPLAIVHRDVSPQNVLLGYEGQVKVADFGIALADQRGLGREEDPKMLRGKYAYMSPEQARGEPLDRRSDVFALGVVLWEMLAGRRLFKASGREETLRRVQEAVVPPIELDAIGAPPELGEVLRHALAKNREDRFPSAGALAEELSQVLVALRARVGPTELREVLQRIAPPDDVRRVNKLRADLQERVDHDAEGSGELALGPTPMRSRSEDTRAFPVSRRLESEVAPAVLLVARVAPSDFDDVVRRFGGCVVPVSEPELPREAVFGHTQALEAAAHLATGAAREILLRAPDAALVVAGGEARVYRTDPVVADPLATTRERALTTLRRVAPGELRVDPELAPDVQRRHVLEDVPSSWPRVLASRQPSVRTLESLRRGPLVGRRDVVRTYAEALAELHHGRGRASLLLGAPGVGKSRVVSELRALAETEGAASIVALPFAERADEPYAAFAAVFEVLAGLEGDESEAERAAKIDGLRFLGASPRELAEVGALFGAPRPRPRVGRPRGIELVTALRKAFTALAAERPVLFVLEDLHAVDDETRQLLDLLVAGLREARVLALFTARPGMALPHLHVERVKLEPLDAEASGRLFSQRVGARAVEDDLLTRLHHATGGNPATIELLAESIARHPELGVAGSLVHRLPETLPVPPRLKASVASRVASLPKRARSLVRTLAAAEAPMDFPLLAAVEGIPRDVAEPLVQRLLGRGLLRGFGATRMGSRTSEVPTSGHEPLPARLAIEGGDLVRRAILESLPDNERERVHSRIADVLRRSGAGSDDRVESLAHHAALAGDVERAPVELERAADVALARGDRLLAAERLVLASRLRREGGGDALEAAESCARAAELALEAGSTEHAAATLSLAPEVDDAAVAFRLALARARVEARREHWHEAVAEVESLRASSFWDQASASLRGRAGLVLGRARLESGDVEGSIESFEEASRELSDASLAADSALALCGLATSLARGGFDLRAREVELAALVAAVRHGSGELRCASLASSAELAEATGEAATAAARWADAASVASELGRGEDAARWGIRAAVAAVEAGLENEAARWVVEATRHGKQHDLEAVAALASAVRAALAITAHPDPHFVIGLVRAVEELEALGRYGEAAVALTMLARAHLALDDVGAAIRTLGRAGPLARSAGRPRQEARIAELADRLARGDRIDGS